MFLVSCMSKKENLLQADNSIKENKNRPFWIEQPIQENLLGAVGSAKKSSSFKAQYYTALAIAENEISCLYSVLVSSVCETCVIREKKFSSETLSAYKKQINCTDTIRSCNNIITYVAEQWVDPVTEELYLWVRVKR